MVKSKYEASRSSLCTNKNHYHQIIFSSEVVTMTRMMVTIKEESMPVWLWGVGVSGLIHYLSVVVKLKEVLIFAFISSEYRIKVKCPHLSKLGWDRKVLFPGKTFNLLRCCFQINVLLQNCKELKQILFYFGFLAKRKML